jgi:hypothetical protein
LTVADALTTAGGDDLLDRFEIIRFLSGVADFIRNTFGQANYRGLIPPLTRFPALSANSHAATHPITP